MVKSRQVSLPVLVLTALVAAVTLALGLQLIRLADGDWKQMIWFSPLTAAAPLLLMSLAAGAVYLYRFFQK